MDNVGRQDAGDHAAKDGLSSIERKFRHAKVSAAIFHQDASYHWAKHQGSRQPRPCQQCCKQSG